MSPDRPAFTTDDRTSCFFCGSAPAAWAHDLHGELIDDDETHYVIGNDLLTLCERCEGLFADHALSELLEVARASQDDVRSVGPSLLTAAGPGRRLEHFVEPPEIAALLASGYDDLDAHTGVVEQVSRLWPAEHHVTLPDERPNRWPDDVDRHLVRSPWPALSVADVLNVVWRWVERDEDGLVDTVATARITEVLGWSEQRALTVRGGPDPRER